MKYGIYLKERWNWAAIFLWLLFSIETFLLTIAGSAWLAIYVAVSLCAGFFAMTILDFRHKKTYFNHMLKQTEELDKKYLLPEMMPSGRLQEEKVIHEIVYMMGQSMNEQVANYRRDSKEYKEYVELWVHEIKVPIAATKIMLTNFPGERAEELLQEIEKIESYTEQALFYARSSNVEKDYLIRETVLSDLVHEVIIQNKRQLLQMKTVLELTGLETTVYSDSKWLFFILNQIIGNSIKYAQTEPLKLQITGEEQKERVLLHIVDNGIGIPPGEVERVCEKGFTGSNGRRRKKATGIGLYLCDKLCKRIGHGLVVESEEGKGCHVTLVFPKSDFSRY